MCERRQPSAPPLPLALMGACLSMSASVGPDGDERTRERLGAPAAATCSAPRRVDTQAWRCLPCAVRLQGHDNPLIHILSIAQLMEINEAFHRFGAPCCVHPRRPLRSAQLAPQQTGGSGRRGAEVIGWKGDGQWREGSHEQAPG